LVPLDIRYSKQSCARLTESGIQYDSNTPGMAAHLDGLPAPQSSDLLIKPATASDMLMIWTVTFVQGYERPAPVVHPSMSSWLAWGLIHHFATT
jgi:hypothetical protein